MCATSNRSMLKRLAQPNNESLRATDISEPVCVAVLHNFADQLGPVSEHVRNHGVEIVDSQHDAAHPQLVYGGLLVAGSNRFGRVELVQLDLAVAIWRAQERERGANAFKINEAIDLIAADLYLTHKLESEFKKECLHRYQVIDNDEDVVHSQQVVCFHDLSMAQFLFASNRTKPDGRQRSLAHGGLMQSHPSSMRFDQRCGKIIRDIQRQLFSVQCPRIFVVRLSTLQSTTYAIFYVSTKGLIGALFPTKVVEEGFRRKDAPQADLATLSVEEALVCGA